VDSDGFVRCAHCRGFYEAYRAKCKWCSYDTVFVDDDGRPITCPDRQAVRAIQIEEFAKLPPEAHADFMKPPIEFPQVICGCLHCGPGGHPFEAIEMRWHPVEKMWCCPCTTCGGRGFHFDIHPIEPVCQCNRCGHWYRPERMTHHSAVCPKCGSDDACGWLADEDELEEEFDDLDEPEADDPDFGEDWTGQADDEGPMLDPTHDDAMVDVQPWYPGKDEDDQRQELGGERAIPDDLDHPRPPLRPPGTSDESDPDDMPF
jgi:hypothetical protein